MEQLSSEQADKLVEHYQYLRTLKIENYPVNHIYKTEHDDNVTTFKVIVKVGNDVGENDKYDLDDFCKQFNQTYPPDSLKN